MREENKIIDIFKAYLEKLGYNRETINSWFYKNKFDSMLAMRLANANIVNANKKDKSSHQTHIAITGESIGFFYDIKKFYDISTQDIDYISIGVLSNNVADLCSNSHSLNNQDIVFEDCKVTIGKRTQNQLQLSKKSTDNSPLFNELRMGLNENDLLVFIKLSESLRIIAIGIKESFYSNIIEDYAREYNSNVLQFFGERPCQDDNSNLSKNMTLRVFAEKTTDSGTCYLCGCSLEEYMDYLPDSYKENVIQRGIVKNAYLDRMLRTIIRNENIPTITLVGEMINVIDEGVSIELPKYRILDGLQRTYRLHEIWKTIKYFESIKDDIDEMLKESKLQLSRRLSASKDIYDINIFLELLEEYSLNGNLDRLKNSFKNNEQWFEVWEELTLEQETEKMLILNAGHKEMNYRHQLELLFLNMLPKLNDLFGDDSEVKIIRNKEKTDMQYSKDRSTGEFYFSHIISSFISYGKEQPITTNAELISKIQQDKNLDSDDISYYFVKEIMNFLVEFDKRLLAIYGDDGTKWIAKETVLVGIFAAAGSFDSSFGKGHAFEELLNKVDKLNLGSYNEAKQLLDVSKVNLGNITKRVVMEAVLDLLNARIDLIVWNNYFGR